MLASFFSLDRPNRETLYGAPSGFDARALAALAHRAKGQPVLFVAQDDMRAAFMAEALAFFDPSIELVSFPAWDCLPYDRISPHADVLSQRLAALGRARRPFSIPCVYLTTVAGLAQRTLPPEALDASFLRLEVGKETPPDRLRSFLVESGFISVGTVRESGEFAVRGGIVDLFPAGYETPFRLDFFGDEIDSIRAFDPLTQTTIDKVTSLDLRPMSEVLLNPQTIATFRTGYRALFGAVMQLDPLYEAVSAGQKFPGLEHWLPLFYAHTAALFDYLPKAVFAFDYQAQEAYTAHMQQVADFYAARQSLYQAATRQTKKKGAAQPAPSYKPVPVAQLYMEDATLQQRLEAYPVALFSPFSETEKEGEAPSDLGGRQGRDFAEARAGDDSAFLYKAVAAYVADAQSTGRRVAVACYSKGSADRLGGLLRQHGMQIRDDVTHYDVMRRGDVASVAMIVLGLAHGFTSPDLVVLTEQDILGDRMIRAPRKRRAAAPFQMELGSLSVGDFVVHAEHGIGRYEGLEAVNALGAAHDCVKLIYDGGDKLFVPVENIDVLSRYGGADCGAVLDKLGGVAWQARKARVKKRLKDIADALLKVAAERALRKGDILQAPETMYQEFAARFPYPETDDQLRAIESVLDDLCSGKPMDRLVCGDVGFGKTEIALRAAFAAVLSGVQVAVVVPTTLLARQHYQNFTQRFAGFPIRIGQLSRMVGARDAKLTKEGLKDGTTQIVVGTHALLAKDVGFDNLGLLIIDEEQHFGVKQKERLKELRTDVHVLTLTATPIPRTLQLALAGVRELSLIATPPVDRLAVKTFVLPFDPLVIREALMREHYRGGQSFYVCPRLEDLDGVAATLRELVPDLKVVSAHGRMTPTQLEDIMTAFDARQFDILLATNIVESGLDIPNANTIVLHRADMFGLAQLYQLRGRVGRGKQRGYAYFTYAPTAMLSSQAQQRLEVIQTLDQLGAGFQLASHDMDIRGAGNLLGEEQSGHIREVGIELYQQMLEDAIAAARTAGVSPAGDDVPDRWTPQIAIGLSVMIPETYVPDLNVRLGLYRRLAEEVEAEDIDSIAAEMVDRFGPLPEPVENLLQTVLIKGLCRRAGVARVDAGPKGGVFGFYRDSFAAPEKLLAWITAQQGTARFRPDQKIVVVRAWDSMENRLKGLQNILKEWAQMLVIP